MDIRVIGINFSIKLLVSLWTHIGIVHVVHGT